eukprot:GHVH01001818.1.p1 GENE.GHVH01001818.1~~GHVH01001818.1.p1  ORF type:complete len:389 (+),score=41.31 GHVH01001818.1:342-1508(+)
MALNLITSQVAIFDNGSGSVKCGLAGKEEPDHVVPSLIGKNKFVKTALANTVLDSELVGDAARTHRGALQLRHPISNGKVTNWTDMEKIWSLCYDKMNIKSPDENPVHLTEAPLNPRQNRDKMAQIFFEQFASPALYISIQAVLVLYASGKTSGLALDCGDGVCHSVPMIEGFVVPYGVERSDIGGRDVTLLLKRLLRRSGFVFNTSAELDIVRSIKESVCCVNVNTQRSLEDAAREMYQGGGSRRTGPAHFTLPDMNTIELGAERAWAPEILFNPILAGKEELGVHELCHVSISRSPIDARAELWNSITLSGGSTLFHGFPDRLLAESRRLVNRETKIRISAPPNRINSPFIGASILSSLSSFKKLWITKKEYEEFGPSIIAKKLAD